MRDSWDNLFHFYQGLEKHFVSIADIAVHGQKFREH